MSWREIDRDFSHRIKFHTWRCRSCGKLAVTGGETPSKCCCIGKVSQTPATKGPDPKWKPWP